jgi:hypothetical protein
VLLSTAAAAGGWAVLRRAGLNGRRRLLGGIDCEASWGNWCVRFTRRRKERGDAADRKRREGCSELERG